MSAGAGPSPRSMATVGGLVKGGPLQKQCKAALHAHHRSSSSSMAAQRVSAELEDIHTNRLLATHEHHSLYM